MFFSDKCRAPLRLFLTLFVWDILLTASCGRNPNAAVPPPLEPRDCSDVSANGEVPNDRFAREGGRTTEAPVQQVGNTLTIDNVAQGRDLSRYDRLDLSDPRPVFASQPGTEHPIIVRARMFLWEHWRDQRRCYLTISLSSVDATSTSHIFVEQGQDGRWRVAMRIVRHLGEVEDCPTYYHVDWITPAGWEKPGVPLQPGQIPDPAKHKLEFRGKCGDVEHEF